MIELAVYALLAVFIFSRLYSSLGKISAVDARRETVDATKSLLENENLSIDRALDVELLNTIKEDERSSAKDFLEKIKSKDKNFSLSNFVKGAERAFELIIKAFAENDVTTLKSLLDAKLLPTFTAELEIRKESGKIWEDTVVSVQNCEIIGIKIIRNTAFIAVRFVSEQINIVKNQAGKIISGSVSKINRVEDIWQFKRELSSSSQKWFLYLTNYQGT